MNKAKLVKNSGGFLGTALKYNFIAASMIIGGIAVLAGKKDLGRKVMKTGRKLGKFAGKTAKLSANIAGTFMEAAASEGVVIGKAIGRNLYKTRVRIYGDTKEFFDEAKMVEAEIKDIK